jgi:hypothetical protein
MNDMRPILHPNGGREGQVQKFIEAVRSSFLAEGREGT